MAESRFRVFLTVVETGSITQAAKKHAYSQPGVSHLLDSLEEDFGVRLLNRTKKGTVLTSEGELIYPYIKEMIRNADMCFEVAREIKGLHRGRLRIGSFTSVALQWVPDLLKEYMSLHPGVSVSLKNGNYPELEEYLTDGLIDCAFLTQHSNSSFNMTYLAEDPFVAVLPAGHKLAKRKSLDPSELADEDIILPAEGSNYDIQEIFHRMGKPPRIRFEMNDDLAAVGMVKVVKGVTFLPGLLLENYPRDGIAVIPIEGITRKIGLAYVEGRYKSPPLEAFEKLVLKKFGRA